MPEAKRRLSDFSFEEKGCHISLVGPEQGGPANGRVILVKKGLNVAQHMEGNMEKEMIEKAAHIELVKKAVEEALEPVQKALDAANAKLAEIETKEAEAKLAVRKAAIAEAIGADNAELDAKVELFKDVSDEVFDVVLKGLKPTGDGIMFKSVGSPNATKSTEVAEESREAQILKQMFNTKE